MNPDNSVPSREELERITAPRASLKLAGDETSPPELRETWLALGDLLDRNTPEKVALDDAAVRAALFEEPASRFKLGRAVILTVAALAACLVFALWIMHGIMAHDEASRPKYVHVPQPQTPVPTTHKTTRPTLIEVAWDDRMTGRIAQVKSGVRQLQGPSAGVGTQGTRHDERVDQLRSRINTLQRSWGENKL